MGFVDAIKSCLSKYVDFNGRARRSEYWFWVLFIMIVTIILQLLMVGTMSPDGSTGATFGPLTALIIIFSFGVFLPSIAVSIRRLHDSGKSGWWYLLNLIPFGSLVVLYFMIVDSEAGANKYGPNPKGMTALDTPNS